MAEVAEQEVKVKIAFVVRNDKFRGLLVETLETMDGNQYFFKFHDQPISKHCQQLQTIIKAANVQRTKKLHVDMTDFVHEYIRLDDNSIMFRGTKLKSVVGQIEKVYTTRINKEFGIKKRQESAAVNKQAKIVAKNAKLKERYISAEAEFQAERARRIQRLFGAPAGMNGNQGGPSKLRANIGGGTDEETFSLYFSIKVKISEKLNFSSVSSILLLFL